MTYNEEDRVINTYNDFMEYLLKIDNKQNIKGRYTYWIGYERSINRYYERFIDDKYSERCFWDLVSYVLEHGE